MVTKPWLTSIQFLVVGQAPSSHKAHPSVGEVTRPRQTHMANMLVEIDWTGKFQQAHPIQTLAGVGLVGVVDNLPEKITDTRSY